MKLIIPVFIHTDQYAAYEDQLQDFLQAAENLQSSLSQQRPRVERLGPAWRAAPGQEGQHAGYTYPRVSTYTQYKYTGINTQVYSQ